MERKFELLGIDTKEDINDCGAEFAIVDLSVVSRVRQESSDAFKGLRKEYGLSRSVPSLYWSALPVACVNDASMP